MPKAMTETQLDQERLRFRVGGRAVAVQLPVGQSDVGSDVEVVEQVKRLKDEPD